MIWMKSSSGKLKVRAGDANDVVRNKCLDEQREQIGQQEKMEGMVAGLVMSGSNAGHLKTQGYGCCRARMPYNIVARSV